MPPLKSQNHGQNDVAKLAHELFARRDFIKLMGASIALLSLNSCRNRLPLTSLVPMARMPEDRILGLAESYTTSFPMPGFTQGLVVTINEGRPTKIECNPLHPSSLGGTSTFAQASILDLYDPYRLQTPHHKGQPTTLTSFQEAFSSRRDRALARSGQGLAVLVERTNSPSWIAELDRFIHHFPKATLCFWDPLHRDSYYQGTSQAFGEPIEQSFDFSHAQTVLSIDSDFLGSEPGSVRNARNFYSTSDERTDPKRLYVAECFPSLTGAKADHRWPLNLNEIGDFIPQLENELNRPSQRSEIGVNIGSAVREIAVDLKSRQGRSIIAIGTHHEASLQARVHRLNAKLGNFGKTIFWRSPLDRRQCQNLQSLDQLLNRADQDEIDVLLIFGGNPVFNAPSDFDIRSRLRKISAKVHLTLHENETSADCDWVIPMHHYLESWGDVQSEDGSFSLMQPLIDPLHHSISQYQLLNWLKHQAERSDLDTVKEFWRTRMSGDFNNTWHRSLQTGVIEIPSKRVDPVVVHVIENTLSSPIEPSAFDISLRPDPNVWDGQFGENAWMQELPKPFTNLTWDNALLISPQMAKSLDLDNQDIVELTTELAPSFQLPVLIVPGLPSKTATLHFGYGRTVTSPVNQTAGFNAYLLRGSKHPWSVAVRSWRKTNQKYVLAITAAPDLGHRDDIYREQSLTTSRVLQPVSLDLDIGRGAPTEAVANGLKSSTYQWGMSIDLHSCIGCSACVVACQSENNIPIVGKAQVLNGRIMHWIRVDRYSRAGTDAPAPQPITCMHCEQAPCEVVCPVQATSHSSEGLNQMVYNRCVGTRYCSNNCPYKVRRFNFYKFADDREEAKLQRNPNVSVRDRGVMEKCTYCVQRIQQAHITADKEIRNIVDGEIRTACEAVCPTQAITFGNILDPNSRVRKFRDSARSYGLLTELGTRPRTTYLQAKRNANPHLEGSK